MITPNDFRQKLLGNEVDQESLIAEYRRLWEENARLTQHITHLQEGSTMVLTQKRAYQAALKDMVSDLRTLEGRVSAPTILRHLNLISEVSNG